MSEFVQTSNEQPRPITAPPTAGNKGQEVIRAATAIYQQSTDWASFYRDVLGIEGIVRRQFTNSEDIEAFEQGPEFAEIQQMLAKLRERSKHQSDSDEPTRVITVRLPKCLHESLRAEAHQKRTSMNQLCISKLLQIIDITLVPSD